MRAWILCLCCAALFGCGAPAIIDASTTIAAMRQCEAAELSLSGADGDYQVVGCGPGADYSCDDGFCVEGAASPDEAWASDADAALASVASRVTDCRGEAAVTVQLHLDGDGHPQGMASEPELVGEERACIGRLMLDHVDFPASGSERLVAYRYGDSAVEPETPFDFTGTNIEGELMPTTEPTLDEASPPASTDEEPSATESPDEGEPEDPETLQ